MASFPFAVPSAVLSNGIDPEKRYWFKNGALLPTAMKSESCDNFHRPKLIH